MTEQISFASLLEHPVLLAVLIVANWPLYRWFVQILFGGVEGMGETVRYWFVPDLYSFLTNRYFEDLWAELRLTVWFLLCVGSVVAEYALINSFLDWWYVDVICCKPIN